MAVIVFNHLRRLILQRLREGMDMRDIRDPQEIGEVLLARHKRVSVLDAADDLIHMDIRRYEETDEQVKARHERFTAKITGLDRNGDAV